MKILPIITIVILFTSTTYSQSTQELFNRQNLDGWYAFDADSVKHDDASEIFTVEDGIIRLFGPKAGYLMSEKAFTEFQLTVEFRWNIDTSFVRKSNKKNSGVMYLVPSDAPDMLWPKGIQFQIKEEATGDFVLLQDVTLTVNGEKIQPGRSIVVKRIEDAENSIGEWNTLIVTVKENKVTQELNGKIVNEGVGPSVKEGRILLQYEGFPIDFRKVEIVKY
ncbi:MAG: DUF1080 domain-containing protein [Bacteroidales bacterium]|nr:DUF1080 domain-containing protein [Bacteroidales bacterium]